MDAIGNVGEYTAMLWPPISANEIIVSEIVGIKNTPKTEKKSWLDLDQREISRIKI